MDLTRDDAIVLLYSYGVALSGGWVVTTFGIRSRWVLLLVTLGLAVFWTVYYRLGIVPRLERADDD